MSAEELQVTARALATAVETVAERLDDNVLPMRADAVLAEIDDDEEAALVASEWIEEAAREVERRRRIAEEDMERRANARW
jgi:hypothetical protein